MRKYGSKYSGFIFSIKLVAAWCLLIGSVNYITGQTNAYYNDTESASTKIQAGIWVSALRINNISLEEAMISLSFKNVGADMKEEGKTGIYEVYFSEDGSNEILIHTDDFEPLDTNEETLISFSAGSNGIYKFKIFVVNEEIYAKWSEAVAVTVYEESELTGEAVEEEEQEEEQEQAGEVTIPEAKDEEAVSDPKETITGDTGDETGTGVKEEAEVPIEEKSPPPVQQEGPNVEGDTSDTPVSEASQPTDQPSGQAGSGNSDGGEGE